MSRAATYVERLLPEYVRTEDDGTLASFLSGVGTSLAPALRTADLADPDTSVTGTAEVANPAASPRLWLPWLAYLTGISIAGLADADVRGALADATVGQRRGSTAAIIAAVQRTLTGAKQVVVIQGTKITGETLLDYNTTQDYNMIAESYGGEIPDPYMLNVLTVTSQTPDEPAALAAALSEKPAGIELSLAAVAAATYQAVLDAHPTYLALDTAFDTYGDLIAWEPPTP